MWSLQINASPHISPNYRRYNHKCLKILVESSPLPKLSICLWEQLWSGVQVDWLTELPARLDALCRWKIVGLCPSQLASKMKLPRDKHILSLSCYSWPQTTSHKATIAQGTVFTSVQSSAVSETQQDGISSCQPIFCFFLSTHISQFLFLKKWGKGAAPWTESLRSEASLKFLLQCFGVFLPRGTIRP